MSDKDAIKLLLESGHTIQAKRCSIHNLYGSQITNYKYQVWQDDNNNKVYKDIEDAVEMFVKVRDKKEKYVS